MNADEFDIRLKNRFFNSHLIVGEENVNEKIETYSNEDWTAYLRRKAEETSQHGKYPYARSFFERTISLINVFGHFKVLHTSIFVKSEKYFFDDLVIEDIEEAPYLAITKSKHFIITFERNQVDGTLEDLKYKVYKYGYAHISVLLGSDGYPVHYEYDDLPLTEAELSAKEKWEKDEEEKAETRRLHREGFRDYMADLEQKEKDEDVEESTSSNTQITQAETVETHSDSDSSDWDA